MLTITLAVGLLGLAEVLGQHSTTALVETNALVQHTHQVIDHLDAVLIALLDAETAARGFALTQDEAQLDPQRTARPRALANIEELRVLMRDNPAQAKRLDDLQPIVVERLDYLERGIAIQRRDGFERQRVLKGTFEGLRQMNGVRTGIAVLVGSEQQLLAEREATTRASVARARSVQRIGTLISVLLFVTVLVRLRAEAQRRKESEQLARQNEEDLATTLHSLGDGVIATDAAGLVRRMNPVAEALTGWTMDEARGRSCREVFCLVDEVTGKDAVDPITTAIVKGTTVAIDDAAVLVAKDGTKRRIAHSAAPIRSASGVIRGAVLVFHDITKVLDDARSLRRTHRFLDSVLENLPHMLFVKDAHDLAFVRLNRAGELLLGTKREQLLGKTDFAFFPADQAKAFVEKDRETLRGKEVLDIAEEPLTTPNGMRWLHTKKVPILDEHGEPEYLLGISEDITERRRAEVLLRASTALAEVAHRELESFSYSVAHDLRAPLRSIDGFSQALIDDYSAQLDEQGKDYLGRVRNGARRMAELIDDLLALARVSRTDLVRTDVDVTAAARQAGEEARKQRNPAAALEVAEGMRAHVDLRLVRVLLENLLSNAFKFSSKRPDARVEVGITRQGADDVFFVRDNGAGFDLGAAKKLFTAFQRYHRPTEYEGTGIGLATAERIVNRHGGRIWAESTPGSGATFFFILERGDSHR